MISTYLIIIATAIVSYIGFNNQGFFARHLFSTNAILNGKQWDRVITSAFLHADWVHLILNLFALFIFASPVIRSLGIWQFLLIYFASIIGGNLLSLFIYRRDMTYTAVGASGGVCGVLFAAIALDPDIMIYFMYIIPIPGWIFAILYLVYSIYGMKNALGNIGHSAHLGGAVAGFAIALIFDPQALFHNTLIIILITIPLIALGYIVYRER